MDGIGSSIPRAENGDMGSAAEFARVVGGLGISNETTVVVYDTPSQRMGMVAWIFPVLRTRGCTHPGWRRHEMARRGPALDTQLPHRPAVTYVAGPVEGSRSHAGWRRDSPLQIARM